MVLGIEETALAHIVDTILITRLRLTGMAKFAGFLVSWFSTAMISILMSQEPTVNSAQEEMFPAALEGTTIGILLIAIAGRRKSKDESSLSESENA